MHVPARTTSVLLAVAMLGACGSAPSASTGAGRAIDVDDVYALAGRSLRAAGVYHVSVESTVRIDDDRSTSTRELWIDAARDAVREEVRATSGPPEVIGQRSVMLTAHGVRWVDGTPGSTVSCHGEGVAVAALLGCPGVRATSKATAQRRDVDGRQLLVLSTHDVIEGEDSRQTSDALIYLDPASGLPERRTESGTVDDGSPHPLRATDVFRAGVVPPGTLPAHFFESTSLGWHPPDLLSEIPTGVPIYWWGVKYRPAGALPPLTLSGVTKSPGGPGYSAILQYSAVADRFGPAMLTIQEWTRADWEASNGVIGIPTCPGRSALVVAQARVELRCSEGAHGVNAFVHVADAVLVVNAPSVGTASGTRRSPYDEQEALVTAVGALSARKES